MLINSLRDHFASPPNGVKFLPQLFEQLVHVELRVAFDLLVGLGNPRRLSGRPWGGASATGGRRAVKSHASGAAFLPLGTAFRNVRLVERIDGSDRIPAGRRIHFSLLCWGRGLLFDASMMATYRLKSISTPICSKTDAYHRCCNSFSSSSRHCTNIRPDPCKPLRCSSRKRYKAVKRTVEAVIDKSDVILTVGWMACSNFLRVSSSACRFVIAFGTS